MDQVLADTLTANLKSAGPWCRPLTLCPARTPANLSSVFLKGRTCDGHSGTIFPNSA